MTGDADPWRPDTTAVRGGLARSQFEETAEALYLTSGYVYENAAAAEAAFSGETDRYVYSRYGNPTVSVFTERLRRLEGAEACYGLASGMSAVFYALAALLGAGDRVVASRSLFGSCFVVLDEILPRWGVSTEFVDGEDLAQWERALSTPAQAVFFETPANPMQTLVDVEAVSGLAHAAGATVVVDNAFASPVGQRPLRFGADVVVYSATKHIDGQGRVMGGAVLGTSEFIGGRFQELTRHTGPTLSPFNAWTLAKGLETLGLRVRHSAATALRIAGHLEQVPGIRWVRYPLLPSHPQFDLAQRQMELGGTILTFELDAPAGRGKDRAFEVLDALRVVDISNNLGDAKSLATHPATTTHRRLGAEGRAAIGLTDGVLRLSVGLEDPDDLLEDLDRALRAT
ncbi:O-succinylhomoserine sulfhydrylase [Kineococcus radiotolerans]|uniref:O-succinylhomoserine sulfhydrylase n=1 Tax=Kineococcus radiotolerans (strain ATCC BAA-149 / DSM 14245 / SRS30216) TaxID=266940 RepID=A6WDQ0_KINRD|nr:O-succinylhomoserine sulfhydrylase [Kineococcus radiotolerans]ABS04939.1 O-succinylhomoserine sulfhydrylase [Kineococcus radiotolerans SRS30216 = ATCC BAA-149]